jgi:hypothetical protein
MNPPGNHLLAYAGFADYYDRAFPGSHRFYRFED